MKFLLLLILSLPCFAIPERDYATVWMRDVLEPLDSVPAREFTNAQGIKIRYRVYRRGKGLPNIVVSPGRTEPMKKYFELVHDIPNANFYLIDHQGQGESERLLADPEKGYVRHFSDYVNDFAQFMEAHVFPATQGEKLYLIAHSMGAAIATRYLDRNPRAFDKIAFSSPMFDIYTEPYSRPLAVVLSKILLAAGKARDYAPDRGPYVPEEDIPGVNNVTHSEARIEANKWLFLEQELTVAGPTVRWVSEALSGTSKIYKVGRKVMAPVLLFQAGLDEIVKPTPQIKFCALAPSCKLVPVPGAFHEVLQEVDPIRDGVLAKIRAHLGL